PGRGWRWPPPEAEETGRQEPDVPWSWLIFLARIGNYRYHVRLHPKTRSPPPRRGLSCFEEGSMASVSRRTFLKTSLGSLAGLSALSYGRAADAPNDKVVLALIGIGSTVPGSVGGRGRQLLRPFGSFKDVEIAYLCDIDEN